MKYRSLGWLSACLAVATVGASIAACSGDDSTTVASTPDAGGGMDSAVTPGMDAGQTVVADGAAAVGCPASTKECVSPSLARVCPADGSGWLSVPCGAGDTCAAGVCNPGLPACTAAQNTCTSATAPLLCNANGQGFTASTCPTGTTCTGPGLCQGACVVGSGTCSGDATGAGLCADGNTITQTACPSGQLCVTTSGPGAAFMQTACKPAACSPNSCPVCGDKTNSASDQTKFTSSCVSSPTGFVYEATGCLSPTTCNPTAGSCSSGGGYAQCQSACTPGATRCSPTSNGIQTCDATGNWPATVTACNTNPAATTLLCIQEPTGAVCGDAFCASGGTGTCDASGNLRSCGSDGKLAAGVACAAGACVASGGTFFGIQNGSCQTQCQPGDSRCTGAGATSYETCGANGLWGASTACAGGVVCFDYNSSLNRPATLCGGVCSPGRHRCTGTDGGLPGNNSIETCDATGAWGAAAACTVGVCQSGPNDSACIAQCVPSALVCTGSGKLGAGTLPGREATATCTAQGLYPTFAGCAGITDGGGGCCVGNTTCRTGASGNATGCVECVGTAIPGGNEYGQTDTKCSDTTGDAGTGAIESCGATNIWPAAPTACPNGTSCATGSSTQVCNGCFGLPACTNSGLAMFGGGPGGPPNCGTVGEGPPGSTGSPWGGFGDCCSNAQGTVGSTNQTAFCH